MRRNKWKKAGLTVLSAVFMGSLSIAAADTGIPALAATKDVAVTEYDEAALEKFKDNTLEYGLSEPAAEVLLQSGRIHGPYKGPDVSDGGGSARGGG